MIPLLLGLSPRLAAADKGSKATHVRVVGWTGDSESKIPPTVSATVQDKPAKIIRVLGPESDLLLMVVFDLTGDLNAAGPASQAVLTAIDRLPSTCWVAVLRGQDGIRVLADPVPDRTPARQAIEGLQIAGKAAMIEVAEPTIRLAEDVLKKSPVRVAVLVVSDSNIYNYREDYTNPVINPSDSRDLSRRFPENLIREKTTKLAESLSAYSAPLFVAQVTYLPDRLNEAYQNGLRQMAIATGGAHWIARVPSEVETIIAQAFERIQSHWSLEVELPQKLPRNYIVQLKTEGVEFQQRTRFITR